MNPATDTRVATIAASGASALRITGASGNGEADWRLAHKLARALSGESGAAVGVTSVIPTYESVLVEFDAMSHSHYEVQACIEAIIPTIDLETPLKAEPLTFTVPVLYGGDYGPDLHEVAELSGLTPDEVIEAHMASTYTVRCLGAPGGSPMLDAPSRLTMIPRLTSPRASVPTGVVSLAGRQATLTPATAPGGWRYIGQTPFGILDLSATPFVPYEPGDLVSFTPIDENRFAELQGRRLQPDPVRHD